ncbi:hypothetical protein [Sharpea azabuensis]|uniref:hypothetical protein n=1 Tax=Sharpea azabuensis TaxID=322505 RepID=UPI002E8139A0|nr:hypothetical protein [Sharpea azabuensis]MEE3309445.1 hypothetical protein [Sharpea azabuensis]
MQIVIDIDEHIYKQIMADSEVYVLDNEVDRILIENAIYNGTPLPEHHGRLIDSEALGNYFWDNRSKLFEYKDLQIAIDNAPTIIEGDDSE